MHKYLRFAIKQAQQHEYPGHISYRHCAVIVKGGSIVSIGFNQSKTNSFVEHYTSITRGPREYCVSTHAEMHAVIQARGNTDLTGCKMYVARINYKHNATMNCGISRPCPICQNVMNSYGIKKALYTIDDFNYGVMKVQTQEITDKIIKTCKKEQ